MYIEHKKHVPYVEQLQQTECGLCSVAMILRYFKSYESMSEIRQYLEVGRDGMKLSAMAKYLNSRNIDTKIYRASARAISRLSLPAILFWNNEHFVVVEKVTPEYAIIVDPACGRYKVEAEVFENLFSNIVLTCIPNKNFVPKKERVNVWKNVSSAISERKSLFMKVVFISLIIYGAQLGIPIIIQNLIDSITYTTSTFPTKYIFISLICVLLFAVLSFCQGKELINLQIQLDKHLTKGTFSKLLRLPYKYFESRSNGDLLFRLSSLSAIRTLLSDQVIRGILQVVSIVFVLLYIFAKSKTTFTLVLGILAILGTFIIIMRKCIVEANQREIIEDSKVHSIKVEIIYAMLGIKISGIEDEIYNAWKTNYKKAQDAYRHKNVLVNIYNTAITMMKMAGPFVILWSGVLECLNERISIGGVLALYSLADTLFSTSVSVFNMWNDFVTAQAYLERIKDIMDEEEEITPAESKHIEVQGNIYLKDVSFAYTKHSDPVLKDINLEIKKGEKIAVVGASGSGKSTFTKLLLGLYEPTEGSIYFDGVNSRNLDKKSLRKQIGIVPQDMSLFNKTIFENIAMNNPNITIDQVAQAAKLAGISEEIEAMPMKYHTFLSDMGLNLSGGQRQRIVLSRALVNCPCILILDEATSSLDSVNERKVMNYLKQNGGTIVTIAHRLSTIFDADKILVLDKGRIVQQGTHQELLRQPGIYRQLYFKMESRKAG